MTDLLLKPEDTGEIRTDTGQTTTNLTYVTHAPLFRRPDATAEIAVLEGGCRTVVPNDEDFEPSRPIPHPDPLPPPPPPTPAVDDRPLSAGEEVIWDYAPAVPRVGGRHRRPSRWDWLTVPLSLAVQRLSAAWSEK